MAEREDASPSCTVRRRAPLPPLVANALLAFGSLASVALALGGAELLARHWTPDYLARKRGLQVYSRWYGWGGRPGAVASMGGGRVSLNARGYRGRELTLPKATGRTRVAVVGDSLAFGFGVADEQTFPYLLDVRDNGLEAGNLAVAGYGPGQELLVLQRDALPLDPDVVILAVCLRNDFVDAVLPVALYDGVTPRPRFRLVGDGLVLDDGAVRRSAAGLAVEWLSDYSHVLNRLSTLLPRRETVSEHDWRYRKQEVLRDPDYAFRLTFALVMEMQRACQRRGVGFLVAAFPSGLDYEMKPSLPERFLESLNTEGVWVVDMKARFRARDLTPAAIALDRTGHLSPRGHVIACEILEREIASRAGQGVRRPGERPTLLGMTALGSRRPAFHAGRDRG
jgi:hypothetical protein